MTPSPRTPPSVLVIEDDVGTRDTVSMVLQRMGMLVHTAGLGEDGIAIARVNPCDIVVVDWRLPDLTGTEVIRALAQSDAPVPFVLISGYLTTAITVEAMRLGACNIVEKPFDIDDLVRLICSVIERGPIAENHGATSLTSRPPRIIRPGSAAERWALYVLKACESVADVRTLSDWAACAGVSYSSLRESCRLVGVRPHDARDLARVLRAIITAGRDHCSPDLLLDVRDSRTLRILLRRAGLESPTPVRPVTVDEFLRRQHLVRADNIGLQILRRMLHA